MLQNIQQSSSQHEKLLLIKKEMALSGFNIGDSLSMEQLYRVLDKKSNREFDRTVGIQIYNRMEKDVNGKFTLEEFIKIFLEAEEIIQQKIDNSKQFLDDYFKQRKEVSSKLEECRHSEKFNNYGIMEGSRLNVQVIEGQDLPVGMITVQLQVEDQVFQTKSQKGPSPSYDDQFVFQISSGNEVFKINVTSQGVGQIGQLEIQVNNLRDQSKHDEWHDLYDKLGNRDKGILHLNLQWIHSRIKYLSDLVKHWDDHIKEQEEDLIDFERDLKTLSEPFKTIQQFYVSQLGYSTNQIENVEITKQQIKPIETQWDQYTFFKHDQMFLQRQFCALIIFISLFLSFDRCVFLDVSELLQKFITNQLLIFWENKLINEYKLKILTLMFVITTINDIFWLNIYSSGYFFENKKFNQNVERGLLRFIIVISYFLVIIKFATVLVFAKLTKEFVTRSSNHEQQDPILNNPILSN